MTNTAEDLTQSVTAFHTRAEWTGVTSAERHAWLALRRSMLTASDMAAIIGEDKSPWGREYRSAFDVYVDKITERADEVLTLDDPRFWGLVLEQPILKAVAAYHHWEYRAGGALLRSREYPFLGCTLDAEIDRGQGLGWETFEGKTTRLPMEWDQDEEKLPTRVLIQVQQHLIVTGAPCAQVFALLQGSRPCLITIEPSEDFRRVLVHEAERFMHLVRTLDPPPVTHTSMLSLRRLFPKGDGSMLDLPPEAVAWTREIQALSAQIKELQERDQELRNMLRACIGEATFGVLAEEVGGKRMWRWQQQESKGYFVQPRVDRALIAMKDPAKKKKPEGLPGAVRLAKVPAPSTDNDTVARFRTTRRRSPR